MEIIIKERDQKGFALATENDKKAGTMTYSIAGEHQIIIDHTEVDPAFGGQDVGKKMLLKIVEMAREKDIKIIPLCRFANAMFQKMPEIRDVLKE